MPSHAKTFAVAMASLVLAGAALVGCSPATVEDTPAEQANASAQTSADTTTATQQQEGATPEFAPDGCPMGTVISRGYWEGNSFESAKLIGEITDRSEREFAVGEVTYNDAGEIFSYAVAAADALPAIGGRFCVDYVTVAQYNYNYSLGDIHPGDVLLLNPDTSVEWVVPYTS